MRSVIGESPLNELQGKCKHRRKAADLDVLMCGAFIAAFRVFRVGSNWKTIILFPLAAGKTIIILAAKPGPTGMSESGSTTIMRGEERRRRESDSIVTQRKYHSTPRWKPMFSRSKGLLPWLDLWATCSSADDSFNPHTGPSWRSEPKTD